MKKLLLLLSLLLLCLSVTGCNKDNNALPVLENELMLTSGDLPQGYGFGEEIEAISTQPLYFYENPGLDGILAEPEKSYQTLTFKENPVGTIFYFNYEKPSDASMAAAFLKGFLWGDFGGPSPFHPEEIFIDENNLMILSFDYSGAESGIIREIIEKKTGIDIYYNQARSEFTEELFNLPGHGSLALRFNNTWNVTVSEISDNNMPTWSITPNESENPFLMLVSADLIQYAQDYNEDYLYAFAYYSGNNKLVKVAQEELHIDELSGLNLTGYYYLIYDEGACEEDPEDWKYLTQGILRVGDLILIFSIFTDDADSKDIKEALEMLRYARHMRINNR